MKKALSLGAKAPLIASFGSDKYSQAHLVTLLAALEQTYVVKQNDRDDRSIGEMNRPFAVI